MWRGLLGEEEEEEEAKSKILEFLEATFPSGTTSKFWNVLLKSIPNVAVEYRQWHVNGNGNVSIREAFKVEKK